MYIGYSTISVLPTHPPTPHIGIRNLELFRGKVIFRVGYVLNEISSGVDAINSFITGIFQGIINPVLNRGSHSTSLKWNSPFFKCLNACVVDGGKSPVMLLSLKE
jgi:hypothetical protein